MRRFLLALPLLLVVGLLFIELPVKASDNGKQPSVSVSTEPKPTAATVNESIAPATPLPKSEISGKKPKAKLGSSGDEKNKGFEGNENEEDDD